MTRALCWLPLLLCACQPAQNPDPCPRGICVGNNADLSAPATGDGGACVESWICTSWAPTGNNMYSRVCSDQNRCGTTVDKPDIGPIPLPALDLDFYKCKVEPILDRGCAMMGCHGTATGDYSRKLQIFARGRRRHSEQVPALCLDTGMQDLAKGSGTIMCYGWTAHTTAEWQSNFDSARALMVGLTDPDACDLLAQPVVGGKAHTGVHVFQGKNDPDYVTIRSWLSGAKLGATCDPMN